MKQYYPRITVIKGIKNKTACKNNNQVRPERIIGKRAKNEIS